MSETLVKPDEKDPEATLMELDELWSFVFKKINQAWIWIALWGIKRGKLLRMQLEIEARRHAKSYGILFLKNIVKDIATPIFGRHTKQSYQRSNIHESGKETGETAHVERWNNTLRQRLGRFVRKTLSFSKNIAMHTACLALFLHRYNLERAVNFK